MYKLIIVILFLFPVLLKAQEKLNQDSADSITYQCYLSGDWEHLIKTGKQALAQNIDFKRLRQRMGYAYFNKADYFASQKQYEKALEFDTFDPDTREYLYYCGLNTGNIAYARVHAKKLSTEAKNRLNISVFNPLASIDLEYNYKSNNSDTRSNSSYFRAGIYTQTGYKLSIYQSSSNYKQTVDSTRIKQPDYFALVNWSVTAHTSLSIAYHHLNTSLDGYKYPGNLVFSSLSTHINRFVFGVNGSFFRYDIGDFKQIGLLAGVTLPGKSNFYFNTYLSRMLEKGNNRLIFSQNAGAHVLKSLWVEGTVTVGNIQNYNDHNALYIYNSIDPTLFRTGLSIYLNLNKNFTLYCNYLYDTKQVEQTNKHYIQQSFLGGLLWKH
ncbi:MAG: tetratricopeptide repeat protein [Bacteroidales bacterium]